MQLHDNSTGCMVIFASDFQQAPYFSYKKKINYFGAALESCSFSMTYLSMRHFGPAFIIFSRSSLG